LDYDFLAHSLLGSYQPIFINNEKIQYNKTNEIFTLVYLKSHEIIIENAREYICSLKIILKKEDSEMKVKLLKNTSLIKILFNGKNNSIKHKHLIKQPQNDLIEIEIKEIFNQYKGSNKRNWNISCHYSLYDSENLTCPIYEKIIHKKVINENSLFRKMSRIFEKIFSNIVLQVLFILFSIIVLILITICCCCLPRLYCFSYEFCCCQDDDNIETNNGYE
jgi:hypothetical protein